MQRRVLHLGDIFLVLLALVSLRIVYWQVVRGDELLPLNGGSLAALGWDNKDDDSDLNAQVVALLSNGDVPVNLDALPQPLVQRTRDLLDNITRGTIYDRRGTPLAYDDPANPDAPRTYADASLAHLIGYGSGLRVGITGLERSYNGTLLGLDRLDAQLSRLLHAPIRGSDISLTIDEGLQQQAVQALGGQRGAVLILDGSSGAVLALASQPGFDPNRMLDPAYTAGLVTNCNAADCPAPLLNRVLQGRYTPGSTWKTVTLIAGLDSGQLQPGMQFDFGKPVSGPNGSYYVYRVDGGTIPDPNHKESRLTLEMSYAKSANAAFARIGDEMGAPILIAAAERLGLGEDQSAFPFDLPAAAPQLANDVDELTSNNLLRASTAIGQGELLVTPLSLARVALAVVNDGRMPLPYVVDSLRRPSGLVENGPLKGQWSGQLMQPETARQVKRMMQIVVEQGSGFKAQVQGVTVGGKTGTAQVANGAPHAWFVGYAEQGQRRVVMAVLVENGGEGSMTAAPIFARLVPPALKAAGGAVAPPPSPTPAAATPAAAPAASTPVPEAGAARQADASVMPPDIAYDATATPFYQNGAACVAEEAPLIGSGSFVWPSRYQNLTGGAFAEKHPGIDLGAPQGSAVRAADAGMVVFSGWSGLGYGNVVVIDHGNGFWTLYAHLSQVAVPCGTPVKQNQRIGSAGATGDVSGEHLHFEVRVAGGWIDPLKVLPKP